MPNPTEDSVQTQVTAPADTWETPDFTVVDTALEVTAYSLRTL